MGILNNVNKRLLADNLWWRLHCIASIPLASRTWMSQRMHAVHRDFTREGRGWGRGARKRGCGIEIGNCVESNSVVSTRCGR